jgi:hypothetical protein
LSREEEKTDPRTTDMIKMRAGKRSVDGALHAEPEQPELLIEQGHSGTAIPSRISPFVLSDGARELDELPRQPSATVCTATAI